MELAQYIYAEVIAALVTRATSISPNTQTKAYVDIAVKQLQAISLQATAVFAECVKLAAVQGSVQASAPPAGPRMPVQAPHGTYGAPPPPPPDGAPSPDPSFFPVIRPPR